MCMSYYDEEFMVVCFISDEWKGDPEFAQYLSELSAYSVEKLRELGSSTVLHCPLLDVTSFVTYMYSTCTCTQLLSS